MGFVKAVKSKAKLRAAVSGPSGSGKTYTALNIAKGLGGKIALADSEFGSASKYADDFEFDTLDLSANKSTQEYIKAIRLAESEGYSVIILDSLTHAWDSVKATVDKIASASRSGNSFNAWAQGSKMWQDLEDAIMGSKIHVIVTMRSKTEYVLEDGQNGKKVPKKVGMAPEVRQGSEYAFDVVLEMTHDHMGVIAKTRCNDLDGYCELKPSSVLGERLAKWLSEGAEPVEMIKRFPIVANGVEINGIGEVDENGFGSVQVSDTVAMLFSKIKAESTANNLNYTTLVQNMTTFLRDKKKLNQDQFINTLSDESAQAIIDHWNETMNMFYKKYPINHKG